MFSDRFRELVHLAMVLEERAKEFENEYALVCRESHALMEENQRLISKLENSPKKELTKEATEVLKFVLEKDAYGVDPRDVARKFNTSKAMASHHLMKLFDKKLIVVLNVLMGDENAVFGITQQGRDYCKENGLAS
jgi:DNA-binding MarR family transcriptional regulator